jgi:hypothetical protein
VNVQRLALVVLLVPAFLAPRAHGQTPAPSASPRPILETAEQVIDRLEAERKDPCLKAARENVPCFPVKTEERGFDASVRQGLGIIDTPDKPTPDRPPTREEMDEQRTAPLTKPAVSVTVDPVCMAKSALKRLRGKNDVFYLYRLRDVHGERVALFDHKLDTSRFQGEIAFLGKFDGECEAQVAYRREQRRTPPPASPPPGPRPSPQPSPQP